MHDDETLRKANEAILNARKVIDEAEAALRYVAEQQRKQGITADTIQALLSSHISPVKKLEIEETVNRSLAEIRADAEKAASMYQRSALPPRIHRIKNHI